MGTTFGIGTTLYGKKDEHPDGSYIATLWFVVLLLPVRPLGSYRISNPRRGKVTVGPMLSASTHWSMTPVPLDHAQVRRTLWLSLVFWLAAIVFLVGPLVVGAVLIMLGK